MSKVLMIRYLPTALTFEEKQQLLKHFGAVNVWETKSKRNYIFASFPTLEEAKSSLYRLHQLEIGQRRLVVEYSRENHEPINIIQTEKTKGVSQNIKDYLSKLHAWNPSVSFLQPPPPNLKYTYPDPTIKVLINIIHSLVSHKPFYIQTLHLMNKMCLDNPFQDNTEAENAVKTMFKELYLNEMSLIEPPLSNNSEPESELSSEGETCDIHSNIATTVKRKHLLPKTRKRAAAILSTATIPKPKRKVKNTKVFEEVTVVEPKKISLVVHQDALVKQTEITSIVDVGELGKFEKEIKSVEPADLSLEIDKPNITKKELLCNRISYKDMKVLPVFKNYHPGPPSMRLYIKNLAKTVTDEDVKRIYRRYVEDLSEIEQIGFDVRIMQEGRMKGQGFVTFPSVELAEVALNETNGYLLKDKPMVVQFARVANKKSIE